jgi:hypothetical protein
VCDYYQNQHPLSEKKVVAKKQKNKTKENIPSMDW